MGLGGGAVGAAARAAQHQLVGTAGAGPWDGQDGILAMPQRSAHPKPAQNFPPRGSRRGISNGKVGEPSTEAASQPLGPIARTPNPSASDELPPANTTALTASSKLASFSIKPSSSVLERKQRQASSLPPLAALAGSAASMRGRRGLSCSPWHCC